MPGSVCAMRWTIWAVASLAASCEALQLTLGNEQSVKDASGSIAFGLLKYYTGNNTGDVPGNLPDPYFWWEAGAMFGTLIDYWALTGDAQYNDLISQAMLHQTGDDRDYMPTNQTRTEGNDDQGFWAMAAMSAAENKFPDPSAGQPQWLALVQAVFNEYAMRWDTTACNGGLRWQIFTFNNGFDYKNSISNGCFFNIASRLARFTGNQTYADWATKVFNWEQSVGFITPKYEVFDGAGVQNGSNCSAPNPLQFSYSAAIHLHGSAVMYNITSGAEQATWKTHIDGLLTETTQQFFNNSVMMETACENINMCDNDQLSFKGYLARWMSGTTQMAPYTFPAISPLLQKSAAAAATACSGSPPASAFRGTPGTACGFKWTTGSFDGNVGVGQQMNALSAIMYTLVGDPGSSTGNAAQAPVTAATGGTSQGDASAGLPNSSKMGAMELAPISLADRVAAGFVTSAIVLSVIGGSVYVVR